MTQCCWICSKPTTFKPVILPNHEDGDPEYFLCERHAGPKCSKCHIEDGRFFVHKGGAERQCLCEACCQELTAPKPEPAPVFNRTRLAALGVGLLCMLTALGMGWLLFMRPKGGECLASPWLIPPCLLFVHIMFRGVCSAIHNLCVWSE